MPLVRRILPACVPAVANAPGHRYSSAAAASAAAAAAATLPLILILSDPPQPSRARDPRASLVHGVPTPQTRFRIPLRIPASPPPLAYTPLAPRNGMYVAWPFLSLPLYVIRAPTTLIAAALSYPYVSTTYPLGPQPDSRGNSDSLDSSHSK